MHLKKTLPLFLSLALSANALLAQVNSRLQGNPPSNNSPVIFNPNDHGFSYQGFFIDDAAMQGNPSRQAMRDEVTKQIDIVEAIGLSSDVLSFLQTVPIKLAPASTDIDGTINPSPAEYNWDKKIVLHPSIIPCNDQRIPILLKEFLYAYLDQKMPGGLLDNPDIKQYAFNAFDKNVYENQPPLFPPPMTLGIDSFFVETSTAYLFGVNDNEPFCREKLQANDPDYVAYLQTLFGPTTGAYHGSLALSFSHNNGFSYNGFFVDDSQLQDMPYREEMRADIKSQIDLVESVGLPLNVIAFFQSLPIEVLPENTLRFSNGAYACDKNIVLIQHAKVLLPPILLHEFLHAFHHQILANSWNNADLLYYYQEPEITGAYDPISHMMSNVKEFFACSGTAYLCGTIEQEPFTRAKVEQSQPDFVEYLRTLFGANIGTYQPGTRFVYEAPRTIAQ